MEIVDHGPKHPTILVCECGGSALPEGLAGCRAPVLRYESLDRLFEDRDPDSVEILILHTRKGPSGVALAAITQLALEHPGMQKVAVLEDSPSIPMAKQLTACGFDLVQRDRESEEPLDLGLLIERMQERTAWAARRLG